MDCPPQKSGRTWSSLRSKRVSYAKVRARAKKIEGGGGREKLIQKIFAPKPVSRKILSLFSLDLFFLYYIHVAFLQREAA